MFRLAWQAAIQLVVDEEKKIMASRPVSILGVAVASFFAMAAALANVAPTGAFVTAIPLTVTPYRGLEPHLELAYSSQRGNGLLGGGQRLPRVRKRFINNGRDLRYLDI